MNADIESLGPPAKDHVDLAVEVFRMLADPSRIRLLWSLLDGERSVNELAAMVDKSPAGVSQHLAKLRLARLVRPRRQGTQTFYRIENDHVRQLVQDAFHNAEHAGNAIPQHHRASTEHEARTEVPRLHETSRTDSA